MFNPLEPEAILLALARVLRGAADADGARDEYDRGQLLSAYSVARHLAAEQAARDALLAWLRDELVAVADRPDLAAARAALATARTGADVGAAVGALLRSLGEDDAADGELRRRIYRILAEMADRETAALAGAEA